MNDNFGDVYGLDCHPDSPFVFASSSRDTTLRFSVLRGDSFPLWVRIAEIFAEGPTVMMCSVLLGPLHAQNAHRGRDVRRYEHYTSIRGETMWKWIQKAQRHGLFCGAVETTTSSLVTGVVSFSAGKIANGRRSFAVDLRLFLRHGRDGGFLAAIADRVTTVCPKW